MPRRKATGGKPPKRPIDRYEHTDKKRINNPPVGLVTPETDPLLPTHKVYDHVQPVPTIKPGENLDYDPHLDPQLVWAGKKEHKPPVASGPLDRSDLQSGVFLRQQLKREPL